MRKNFTRIAVLALVSFVGFVVPPVRAQGPLSDWGTPPREYQDAGRIGYRDGIEGCRRDFENHRRPDVNNRDEYRRPRGSRRDRKEYTRLCAGHERLRPAIRRCLC
jgi:hypothetical protein